MNRLSAALTIAVVTGLLMPALSAACLAADSNPSVLVQVTKVNSGSLPKVITVFGTVVASAGMQQSITSHVAAVVQEIEVKPGQKVTRGTALLRLGPTPDTAAAYTKAVSAVSNARDLVQHTQELLNQHLATRQQLADAEKALTDAQASLNALSVGGASTGQTLSAPFDGVVTNISVNVGSIVNPGTAMLDVARTKGLLLRAGAVPEQAETIHQGDAATISALGGDDLITGTVLLRGSMIDPKSGLVPLEIDLPNGNYLAGQAAQARIVTGTVAGYVVPHQAILVNDRGEPYVVQAKNMIAHQVPVQILLSAGAKDVVAGALDPEAALVLAGNHQLKDGMRVRIANPQQHNSK
jgi:membrane fusion protein (multidrug efflux system)